MVKNMGISLEYYCEKYESEWDDFVLNKSMNGTFLQTRNFINYHNHGKFNDCSICFRNGQQLVAVVLACYDITQEGKCFISHSGTTFGGFVVSPLVYSSSKINEIFELFNDFLISENFNSVVIKQGTSIYQKRSTDLINYFLFKYDYRCYNELNYYINLNNYDSNIITNFSANKRRDYRYSLRNGFILKKLESVGEIKEFYNVLIMNLNRLNLNPVHSLEDLIDFKFNRLRELVRFYGVYYNGEMIAGSMVFIINDSVFHTQYLSSNDKYLKLYPMDYLIANLIEIAKNEDKNIFSFGICTEDEGKKLNFGLSRFKEGFGIDYCINRTYKKQL